MRNITVLPKIHPCNILISQKLTASQQFLISVEFFQLKELWFVFFKILKEQEDPKKYQEIYWFLF